ncbi:hypothetical protein PR202_ga07360 [Eleusine coracana subsp. coracana]|uniref:F-box domain-containing protein n=1 Tax=Eleusine coracana subsp. coracana TaxID=191504 RepID=A0AAV5BZD9_ELECO|nr:hypothetical protein PR202_ga07360 [Eleusine coracana subsp. coracana]
MDSTGGKIDDGLSALPDDLLHLILASVGDDAAAVARTSVLSRRWRHVWLHAQDLSLAEADTASRGAPGRFARSVDRALAHRGDADVGSLKIVFRHCRATPAQVTAWLRYAARRVVTCFHLDLGVTAQTSEAAPPPPPAAVVELPSHGRAASVWLNFPALARLRLPTTAATYDALTKLTLVDAWFDEVAPGGGRSLGSFVSACCPRLRVLNVGWPHGLRHLALRTDSLEELDLSGAYDLETLDVDAPNLRLLSVHWCFSGPMFSRVGDRLVATKWVRVSSARWLEEVRMLTTLTRRIPVEIRGGDLTSVRRLSGIALDLHGRHCVDRNNGLWLLRKCTRAEHVQVDLFDPVPITYPGFYDVPVDFTAEGAAPFASVRTLSVMTRPFYGRHFMANLSSLLSRFPCLRSLGVDIFEDHQGNDGPSGCLCDIDELDDHPNVSLTSLQDVKIIGFTGTEQEMSLVKLLFESSSSLKIMTVSVMTAKGKNNDDADGGLLERIGRELSNIPCNDRGRWHREGKVHAADGGCPPSSAQNFKFVWH